jgi:hypothetical protein
VNETPEEAARRLVASYFQAWSSSNATALEAMPAFYGPRVIFHGRSMSLRALMNEKRRFVRRWPDRTYRLRPDPVIVACEPSGRSCTVQSLFSFETSSPARSKRSEGTGMVEFVVDLSGDRPIIASEASMVQDRHAQADQRSIE